MAVSRQLIANGSSVRTLLVIGLAHQRLEALWVADLTVGDRVELALEIVQWIELARGTILVQPEKCRGAKRTDLRVDARARAAARQVAADRVFVLLHVVRNH